MECRGGKGRWVEEGRAVAWGERSWGVAVRSGPELTGWGAVVVRMWSAMVVRCLVWGEVAWSVGGRGGWRLVGARWGWM